MALTACVMRNVLLFWSRTASLLDLVPSVLDWTGIPSDGRAQGQSLRGGNTHERREDARWIVACRTAFGKGLRKSRGEKFSSSSNLCAARGEGPFKYLRHGEGREELYDLASDPHELHNLAAERPHELDLMRARMRGLLRAQAQLPTARPSAVDAEQREALEALGYIE